MTSGKMRRYELKAREEWKKGRETRGVPGPTGEKIEAFKMGFYLSWKIILTREKLYQTFNLHWEKPTEEKCWIAGQNSYILLNNDGNILAQINCYPAKGLRFKYYVTGNCQEIDLYYSEWIDMNDVNRLKQDILEKYISYKEASIIDTEQNDRYQDGDE